MAQNLRKHEFGPNILKHSIKCTPKVVDWACSLLEKKKQFRWHKLVHLMHPILIFTMGQVRQRNGVKPPEHTSFRHKVCGAKPTGRFRAPKLCANTQNMSFGPKGVH